MKKIRTVNRRTPLFRTLLMHSVKLRTEKPNNNTMSSLQAALQQMKGSSKRTRSSDEDEPLQHSLKRLRVNDSSSAPHSSTPSPQHHHEEGDYGFPAYGVNRQHEHFMNPVFNQPHQGFIQPPPPPPPQTTMHSVDVVPRRFVTRLPQHSNLYDGNNSSRSSGGRRGPQTIPDESEQSPGQQTSSAFLTPMNRLLGNLHQQRLDRRRGQS